MAEREDILSAIRDSNGNISRAARKLGVARRTLQNRMRFYGIPKGRAGRRKRKIAYGKRPLKWAVGGAAAAVGIALYARSKSSST
jgi:hypothetical protein